MFIMTADNSLMESMYWRTNSDWYRVNKEKDCYELADDVPERAVESFKLYCERNHRSV